MIRIRAAIERGLRHPVLGPLIFLLLAAALAFVALHEAADDWLLPLLAACVAAVVVALTAVFPVRHGPRISPLGRLPRPALALEPPRSRLVSLRL